MSLAKITLYGMFQWMQNSEDDLFSQLNLPTGMEASDLINTIMMHGAEFEVLYANPQYMQSMIGIWSNKWYHTFERWIKALAIDYDPLENYDRREQWTDAGSKNRTASGSDTGHKTNAANRHNSAQSSEDTTMNAVNSNNSQTEHGMTNEHTVSAYDSSAYQPESKDQVTNDNTTNRGSSVNASFGKKGSTDDVTESTTGIESDSRNRSDSEQEGTSSIHSGRIHGNIGTLTSQAMLQSEFDVARFNLYEEAANLFLTELTIYVY